MKPTRFLFAFIVSFLVNCLTIPAVASVGRSYAVFKVSYNGPSQGVAGGVAGTAFFIAPGKAVSALHVVNEKTFEPAPGFSKVRVWLVHENEPALEIIKSQVRMMPGKDLSVIEFSKNVVAPSQVFPIAETSEWQAPLAVESEGFEASSAGPILMWNLSQIDIVKVPHLKRIQIQGQMIRRAVVDLKASDVQLSKASAFELSYVPIVGTSGGPVTSQGKLIGVNSFANPENRRTTWAVQIFKNL